MQARARAELGGGIDRESGAGTVIVPSREGGGPPAAAPRLCPRNILSGLESNSPATNSSPNPEWTENAETIHWATEGA